MITHKSKELTKKELKLESDGLFGQIQKPFAVGNSELTLDSLINFAKNIWNDTRSIQKQHKKDGRSIS